MNIFAFDDDYNLSALWLDDVRKNKMIVESCQLLSTAINILQPNHEYDVYKTAFQNHPCAKWVRESYSNYVWLIRYTSSLILQRDRVHSCMDVLNQLISFYVRTDPFDKKIFPQFERTPFVNCAANQSLGISYKNLPNTNAAYRMYIRDRWSTDIIKLSWKHGEEPWWK